MSNAHGFATRGREKRFDDFFTVCNFFFFKSNLKCPNFHGGGEIKVDFNVSHASNLNGEAAQIFFYVRAAEKNIVSVRTIARAAPCSQSRPRGPGRAQRAHALCGEGAGYGRAAIATRRSAPHATGRHELAEVREGPKQRNRT